MRVIDVSAGLVFSHGKLLIAQRLPHDHLGGLWEFPGGKREPGETFESCLVRELTEELGIEVLVGELIETLDHTYPEKCVHLRFYRCSLVHGEPEPLGCAAVHWVSPRDLRSFQFPPADSRLLARLETELDLWK